MTRFVRNIGIINRQGATVEEVTIEVNKAKANLENAQRDLAHMSQLNKVNGSFRVFSRILLKISARR